MATQRDISLHLNLSQALVSGVLSGKGNSRASEETRRRILEAARELDYRPSASAVSLRTGRTGQIALLVEISSKDGGLIAQSPDVHGLLEAAAAAGYRVILIPMSQGEAGERQLENLARDRVCDGVCVFSNQFQASHRRIVAEYGLPCVVVGAADFAQEAERAAELRDWDRTVVRVDHDNYRHGFDAVRWLQERGHRKIAWAMADGEGDQRHNLELRQGYVDALAQLGGEPEFLPHIPQSDPAANYLPGRKFSAVIVRYAHGAVLWWYQCGRMGIELPGDLEVVGLVDASSLPELSMTGLRRKIKLKCHNAREVGLVAGKTLVEWAGGRVPAEPLILITPGAPA